MRGSEKGLEPAELRAWKGIQRDNGIEPGYRSLPRPERRAAVNSLYAEQTGQCVYCGRKVSLDRLREYHIEHFRPRSRYPELELDYSNLFLSCGPDSEHETRQTCGNYKDDWFEEDGHVPPAPESCAERFRFRSSGEIAGDDTSEADKMRRITTETPRGCTHFVLYLPVRQGVQCSQTRHRSPSKTSRTPTPVPQRPKSAPNDTW